MIEHYAAGLTRGLRLCTLDELTTGCCNRALPVSGQFAIVAALELLAQRVWRVLHPAGPLVPRFRPFGADRTPLAEQFVRDQERGRAPGQNFARAGNLFFSGRIAMRLLRTGLGRKAKPMMVRHAIMDGWSVTDRAISMAS